MSLLCVNTGFRLRGKECMHSCLIAPAGAGESCNLRYSQTLIKVWENSMTIHVHLLQPGSGKTQTGYVLWPQQRLNHSSPLSQKCSRSVLCPRSFSYDCRLCGRVQQWHPTVPPSPEHHNCPPNLQLMSQDQQINLPQQTR